MRRTIFLSVIALSSLVAMAQSTSPDALYERAMDAITGVGIAHNDSQGLDYFRQSAALGYGPAQIALGYYYETGLVVPKDSAQALDLYRKAAQTGDPLAAWMIGRLYYLGDGTTRDLDAAQRWFKTSAGQKNAYGSYYLARVLVDHDPAKAVPLFKAAADQGLPQAQYYYGKALKDGQGVAQDKFNAMIWLAIAADAGNNSAGQELNTLDGLSLDQMATARAKAHDMEQIVIRAVNARGCSGWDGEFDDLPPSPPPKLQRFCH
jgi:uncharacterized protein